MAGKIPRKSAKPAKTIATTRKTQTLEKSLARRAASRVKAIQERMGAKTDVDYELLKRLYADISNGTSAEKLLELYQKYRMELDMSIVKKPKDELIETALSHIIDEAKRTGNKKMVKDIEGLIRELKKLRPAKAAQKIAKPGEGFADAMRQLGGIIKKFSLEERTLNFRIKRSGDKTAESNLRELQMQRGNVWAKQNFLTNSSILPEIKTRVVSDPRFFDAAIPLGIILKELNIKL